MISNITSIRPNYAQSSKDESRLYVTDVFGNFHIIDIDNKSQPIILSTFSSNYTNQELLASLVHRGFDYYKTSLTLSADETILYLADYVDGLLIFNVTDSSSPKLLSKTHTTQANHIVLSQN